MRTVKLVSSLAIALLMPACSEPTAEDSSKLVTSAAALTSGVSRGCTFTVSYKEVVPPFPPTYVPVITRQASASCPWGAGSVELEGAYDPPQLSLVANDLGVAVSYTNRYSPSGTSGSWLEIRHLAPDTLAVVRSEALQSYGERSASYVRGSLSLLSDGTTLKVKGEKGGRFLSEETFGGQYYVATYPDFFTSTTAPNIVVSETPLQEQAGSWSTDGNLTEARSEHTATVLESGEVLVVGGTTDGKTAEVYNPYIHVSTPTPPLGARHIRRHTATLLPSGKVLVAGGWLGRAPTYHSSAAEVFDPATGTWSYADSMNEGRSAHTATLLPSGKVLVVAGTTTNFWTNSSAETRSVELYDPDTNEWSAGPSIFTPRRKHTATLLYSGKVLVTGGDLDSQPQKDAQLYDPATNSWSFAPDMPRARTGHLAVQLYSGRVMILGGGHDAVDFYDPYSGLVWLPGPTLPGGASAVSATLLYSGEVLVTTSSGQASLYDPSTDAWQSAGTLSSPLGHAATLLHTGEVLVTGGINSSTVQRYTR
ncbi:Kelch repeat-containing protein [Archangium violaceum]|uniref:Kelch repeat-containing protein n=1 Tax=Archangium violaceum TaxID=83451 RepID=UPI001EF0E14A|nr:kelch repeat-containing protein [Archangium violaceum]